MFVTYDENGHITMAAEYRFSGEAVEAGEVINCNGKLYEKGKEPPEPKPGEPEFEERRAVIIDMINTATSARITKGFSCPIQEQTLHFSYDLNDQQNFADTANVAMMLKSGAPGLPDGEAEKACWQSIF